MLCLVSSKAMDYLGVFKTPRLSRTMSDDDNCGENLYTRKEVREVRPKLESLVDCLGLHDARRVGGRDEWQN